MTHLAEEELIEIYYEGGRHPHIDVCAECAAEFRRLATTLDELRAEPEPESGGLEDRVWSRIEAETRVVRMPRRRRTAWIPWAAAAAALAVASFQAGRMSKPVEALPTVTAQQRAEWVALGQHLERTRILLAEAANGMPLDDGRASVARELLDANARFRTVATQGAAALLLDDVGAVLERIATAPPGDPAVRAEIDGQEILFRMHLLESQLRGPKPAAQENTL